jgi:hypothetical protein
VAVMAHLVGTVNLGDVGHEVQDTAGVAPLYQKVSKPSQMIMVMTRKVRELLITSLSYHETSLMKFSLRAMPALASKMEEAGWPFRSEETISSSV